MTSGRAAADVPPHRTAPGRPTWRGTSSRWTTTWAGARAGSGSPGPREGGPPTRSATSSPSKRPVGRRPISPTGGTCSTPSGASTPASPAPFARTPTFPADPTRLDLDPPPCPVPAGVTGCTIVHPGAGSPGRRRPGSPRRTGGAGRGGRAGRVRRHRAGPPGHGARHAVGGPVRAGRAGAVGPAPGPALARGPVGRAQRRSPRPGGRRRAPRDLGGRRDGDAAPPPRPAGARPPAPTR